MVSKKVLLTLLVTCMPFSESLVLGDGVADGSQSNEAFLQSSTSTATVILVKKNGLLERRLAQITPSETILEVIVTCQLECDFQQCKALLYSPSVFHVAVRTVDFRAIIAGDLTKNHQVHSADILVIWE